MKTDLGVSANQRGRARAMRRAPTDAERRLWRLLRDRRLDGLKFRRQVPVGPYIVDFLCVASRLIVEADGSRHAENGRDKDRDAYLIRDGWLVLRFWNHEVIRNREGVLETILALAASLRETGPHPSGFAGHLLPKGEGDRPPQSKSRKPELEHPHA
ncbi:MAG: endonuclease domain-containing protein [Hyphomicrobiales bacterium]|nr:endonuclease domain-containing protein [Hyphomicrobiales bacterium]